MSSLNIENANMYNNAHTRFKGSVGVITLAAAYTITADHPMILRIDPGGAARDVTLPATGLSTRGLVFVIFNDADAAENLVLKQSNGSTTVITIGQGKAGIVFNDGSASATTSWMGLLGS